MGVSLFFIYLFRFYKCAIERIALSKPRSGQLMYYMYIRVVILGALFRHSSIYRVFIYSFIVIGE